MIKEKKQKKTKEDTNDNGNDNKNDNNATKQKSNNISANYWFCGFMVCLIAITIGAMYPVLYSKHQVLSSVSSSLLLSSLLS